MYIYGKCPATPEKSEAKISIAMLITGFTSTDAPVKSMQIVLEPKVQFRGEKVKSVLIVAKVCHATQYVLLVK